MSFYGQLGLVKGYWAIGLLNNHTHANLLLDGSTVQGVVHSSALCFVLLIEIEIGIVLCTVEPLKVPGP